MSAPLTPSPMGDPKDTRNLFLAIVLSLAILLGWQVFVQGPKDAALKAERVTELAKAEATGAVTQVPIVPEVPMPQVPLSREQALGDAPRITITGDRVHGTISLRGARFDDLTLARYRESAQKDAPEIKLLNPAGSEQLYYAEFGWRASGVAVPQADTLWQADATTLAPGGQVTLHWDNGQGLRFERVIALDSNYLFTLTERVINSTGAAVHLHPYGLIARAMDPDHSSIYIQHEGPMGVFDGALAEHKYKDLAKDQVVKNTTTGGWLGFTDKYWLVALLPAQDVQLDTRMLYVPQVDARRFQVDYMAPSVEVAAGTTGAITTHLFAGAKEVRVLDAYEKQLGVKHFDLAIDFGWFYFLTKPFFYALDYLALWLGSFGLAILAFTVILKGLMFPLADLSYISMAKMKNAMPRINELREAHKGDPARQGQELMAFYKKEGINPLSGCWPVLIQIPIFFALYKVLYVSIEMRHAPFFGWIQDLSARDPSNIFTLFGLLPWDHPALLHLGIFPILMGLTMWLQMKMNPPPTDEIQRTIFAWLPLIFTITMAPFAVGLVIYWTWSNILSIAQQYLIMRKFKTRVL